MLQATVVFYAVGPIMAFLKLFISLLRLNIISVNELAYYTLSSICSVLQERLACD